MYRNVFSRYVIKTKRNAYVKVHKWDFRTRQNASLHENTVKRFNYITYTYSVIVSLDATAQYIFSIIQLVRENVLVDQRHSS